MKKILAWLLAIALTATVSIGATLAYLTDTDEDVNVMTLGNVKIDQLEYERIDTETDGEDAEVQEFHDNKPLLPGVYEDSFDFGTNDSVVDWDQIGKDGYSSGIWNPDSINNEVDKMVFVKNKGKSDAYVRTVFAFEAGNYADVNTFLSMVHLNLNETDWTWEWIASPVTIGDSTYFVATATYNAVLEPGKLTEISLSQIALDKTATNEDVEAFGDTYQILVKSQAIQTQGFDDADMALTEGFGDITSDSIPWEDDAPTKGTDLKKAIHYLNGDATTSAISTKITSLTFGLNKDYEDIVNDNEGTLVDVEQDVPAFAYYVPNGSGYDVYVLSNDVIYVPKNSSELFKNLQSMTNLNSSNLNFSRAETMNSLFMNCYALTELDVTNWDVSNNTTFDRLFYSCKKLETITGLGTWDTGNVESLFGTFYQCYELSGVEGVGNWDTGKVTTMGHAFRGAIDILELDLNNWDVSNVKEFNSMFSAAPDGKHMGLRTLKIDRWNPKSAEKFDHMFQCCSSLTELNMAGWNVEKLQTTSHMFADCNNLESVDLTGWNTISITSMDAMFNDCGALTELDLSSFDTSNCIELTQIFEACGKLQYIKGLENWNTANAKTFEQTFSGCSSLKELDLSSFNTRNVVNDYYPMQNGSHGYGFLQMFTNVTSLEKLIVGENISYYGNGNVSDANKLIFPDPAVKDGLTGKWRNVETGETYLGKDIPSGVAATYVADYEYTPSGATTFNALNYLNADSSGTKITTKVSSITYGLSKDYETITSQYTGVLADQEQDGPVYAYYVPNGSNYDVYMLADDTIYAPVDCENLCNGMSALTTVNTANLDVSRTEDMTMMFMGCKNLTNIDLSHWDTSNVTSLFATFANCSSLTAPAMDNWDTSNVTTMRALFSGASKLSDLDVSNWDTSKVTAMNNMFNGCKALTTVPGIGNFDTSKVLDMTQMFAGCTGLTTLDVAGWDTGSVQYFKGTFRACTNLTELDVSDWDVSSVLEFNSMFSADGSTMKLTEIDVTNWNPVSATSTSYMFYGCGNVTSFNLSNWTVPNLGNMYHMFTDCNKLVSVDFGVWETQVLWSMDGMFNDCWNLKSVDMSTFNVSNVTEFAQVFENCSSLEAVYGLENWTTSKGITFEEMFVGCHSLKSLDLSGFDTRNSTISFKNQVNSQNLFLKSFISGCTALEQITFGPYFSFDGDGTAPDNHKFVMPSATAVEGWDGHWYDAEGNAYLPSEIPEMTARTYYAVNPVAP